MRFCDIPGFEDEKQALIQSVKSGHIPHARLFAGNQGAPSLPMALAFITYVNCENPGDQDACGTCAACVKNEKFIHPDVHFVYPVSAVKNITGKDVISRSFIEDWRTFLKKNPFGNIEDWANVFGGENKQLNISKEESRQIIRNLSLKSFEGKYKILLIWLPEFMHPNAANGILKILEEPTENTLFILVSDDKERIIGTILSRNQFYYIRKFSSQEIKSALTSIHHIEETQADRLAFLANGDYNEAVKLSGKVTNNTHEMFREWMRACFKKNLAQLVSFAEDFQTLNKVEQKSFMEYTLNIMRESLINITNNSNLKRIDGEDALFVENFSKVLTPKMIEGITREINQGYYYLERNANPKILFLDISLTIVGLIRK